MYLNFYKKKKKKKKKKKTKTKILNDSSICIDISWEG